MRDTMATMTPREQIYSDDDFCPGCDGLKTECSGTYAACMTRPDFDVVHGELAAFHITVRADPMLSPDEFRIESGEQMVRVIGVDFGSEPSTGVIFHKCGRCEQTLDFGDAEPTEIAIMKRGHDMICPARNGVVNGVFHIDPDPPDIKGRQLDRIAERQRDEALRAGWDGRNWCWCGCASSVGQCPNATCTRHRLAHLAQSRFVEPGAGSFDYAAAFRGVDRSESPERLSGARNHRIVKVDHSRPDGFAQSKIDEIKAMLTAPVEGKR